MAKKIGNKLYIFLKLWVPVLLWCSIIYILSNQRHLTLNLPNEFILRKTAHITEYAILTFLLFRALYNWPKEIGDSHLHTKTNCIALSIILVLLFAISDEYHQTFVIGRNGNPYDIMIDSIGMMVMGLLCLKSKK